MWVLLGRTFTRVRDGLSWRVRKLLGDRLLDSAIVNVARRWRPLLTKPVFIGITGSAGKTTANELILGILSSKKRGIGSRGSLNVLPEVAKIILRLRPTHEFCVAELSEARPGGLDAQLALLQPSIGIVTVVRDDHVTAFASRDDLANEVGKLIAALPSTGTAVLNADDPHVLAMATKSAAKVITYGVSPTAELRAQDISAAWPDRLELTLACGSERVKVRTQLCGAHWIPPLLGAVGGGLAAGLSLQECADGIASVQPFEGRMQPVTTADGVTFIRDDFKAPLWTVDACFEFMRVASAKRKFMVIGMLSDAGSDKGAKYAKTALLAQEIADVTIFVGPWASSVLKTRKPGREDAVRAFSHVRDAAAFINSNTREGDLVLLKGTNKQDHLHRIIMARTDRSIACWRDDCERSSFCNDCPHLTRPSGAPLLLRPEISLVAARGSSPLVQCAIGSDEQVIVGLGNPESRYAGTPHNVGYAVVDGLAASLGLAWDTAPEAWIARGSPQQCHVCLIKIRTSMNRIGLALKQLSENLSFDPGQCILVYDDLDTPIGSIRTRLSGGAGGHRGAASILEAFQTDAFRRVKVGVGQPGAKVDRIEYVLTAFDAASRAAVDQAISAATKRTIEMVEAHARAS